MSAFRHANPATHPVFEGLVVATQTGTLGWFRPQETLDRNGSSALTSAGKPEIRKPNADNRPLSRPGPETGEWMGP